MPATSAIYLYSVPQVANIFVGGVNSGVNMIIASTFGRSSFRIFRRVQNDFDFLLRDIDRQPVSVTGTLTLIINDDFGNMVLSVPMTVINAARAQYHAIITKETTLTIDPGIYSWCVKHTNASNVDHLLYTNQDYTVRGVVEVSDGLLEPIDDPYTIQDWTLDSGIYYSSSFPGSLKSNNPTGNHSALGYFDNYTGTIFVEAGLDPAIPVSNSDWQQVDQFDFTNQGTTSLMNFYGNFNYVRFRTDSITGLSKIVYRN